MSQLDNRKWHQPMNIITEFKAECLKTIRPKAAESWRFKQVWEKQNYAACLNMGRMTFLAMRALEDLDDGHVLTAQASLVLMWRAGHQYALSGNSWTDAWPITGEEDPYGRQQWGGTAAELSIISAYNKALQDLSSHSAQTQIGSGAERENRATRKEKREAAKAKAEAAAAKVKAKSKP